VRRSFSEHEVEEDVRRRVSLVEPGATATELASHNRPEVLESIRNQFGQRMDAEDIADAISGPRWLLKSVLVKPGSAAFTNMPGRAREYCTVSMVSAALVAG
jgi:hypothetical protein